MKQHKPVTGQPEMSHCGKNYKIWMFLSLLAGALSVVLMCMTLGYVLDEFLDYPVASDVSTSYPTWFPTLMYCPRGWIDPEKVRQSNISFDAFRYMVSLLPLTRDIEYLFTIGNYIPDKNTRFVEGERLKTVYLDYMRQSKFESLQQLLEYIMTEPYSVLATPKSAYLKLRADRLVVQKVMTIDFPCYNVVNRVNLTLLSSMLDFRELLIKFPPGFPNTTAPAGRLFVGSQAATIFPKGDEIVVTPNRIYEIGMKMTKATNLGTTKQPCSVWTFEEQFNCLLNCMNAMFCVGTCQLFQPNNVTGSKTDNLVCSTFFHDTKHHCMSKIAEAQNKETVELSCLATCPQPCEKYSFSHNVREHMVPSTARDMNKTDSLIILTFSDPWNTVFLRQFPTYTVETLLCNCGGVISLFLGVSMFTLLKDLRKILVWCRSHKVEGDGNV